MKGKGMNDQEIRDEKKMRKRSGNFTVRQRRKERTTNDEVEKKGNKENRKKERKSAKFHRV